MSMCACNDCGALVDSDDDPDCFIETGNMRRLTYTIVVCETCRWIRDDQRELEEMMAAKAEAEAEALDGNSEVYRP